MKKIFMLILLQTLLFSTELFDLSKVLLGGISYETKTKMRIYNKGITTFTLPIEIEATTEPIEKNETGFVRVSKFKILFPAVQSNKMTMYTKRTHIYDDMHRLVKMIEEINRNGKKQVVSCVPIREASVDNNYTKAVEYKSEVILLSCDNDSQLKMQMKLQKTDNDKIVKLISKKNSIMTYDTTRYVVEEINNMSIDTNGTIHQITSQIKIKDLFFVKYRARHIKQTSWEN